MKKIICTILLFGICCPLWGASVCMHNGVFIATLRKSADGLSYTTDSSTHKWTVNFNYLTSTHNESTIYGYGVCSGTPGEEFYSDPGVDFNLDETGVNCWCKMGGPLVSDWVYYGAFGGSDACAAGCLNACGSSVQTSSEFRSSMYDSVW